MRVRAPAKINLGLEITARRQDGFHEVVSILQAIDLCDEVEVARRRDLPDRAIDSKFRSTGLTDAALRQFERSAGRTDEFTARVAKSIPAAAGLGGGSSDAAITLAAANLIAGEPLPDRKLNELAAAIGSDVAFFLSGGCALVEGRGEIIARRLPAPDVWVVLANPRIELSTPDVFGELAREEFGGGGGTNRLSDSIAAREPRWELLRNDLQAAALRLCPSIGPVLESLNRHTPHVLLSGSGPTCFGLFDRRERAARAERELSSAGFWTWLGRPLGPWTISELQIQKPGTEA